MSRIQLSVLVTALLAASAASANKIERVVVFADRAEVTRTQTVKCDKGAANAVFSGLPDAVDDRALRGDAVKPATTVGVSSKKVNLEEALDERVRNLQNELLAMDDELRRLRNERADAGARAQGIQSYESIFMTMAREEMRAANPNVARWDQVFDLMRVEAEAAIEADLLRARAERHLGRKRERVAARLARLSPASAPANLEASVAVRCGGRGSATVRLSYVVPGATWSPEYDLRFAKRGNAKTGKGTVKLTVAGVIRQSSGEDWTDATVWLSTAKPKLGGEAPVPNPIYVNGNPDDSDKTLVQAQEKRAADLQTGARDQNQSVQRAELEDGGKAFVLKLPRKVTVRADGRPYWFPVDERSVKAESALIAVPKMSPYVFQAASFENPSPYPLMAGMIHVYRGQTYVGDVPTPYRAPGEPMEVSLGVDEEIRVERKDLLEKRRAAGFLSGTQHIDHAYRVLIENRAKGSIQVEIREQLPVSKIEDVRVDLDEKKTAKGFTLDKKRGHLTWKVNLKSGAKVSRDLVFSIHLPKDWKVR